MLDLKEEEKAVAVPEQIIYHVILHQVTPYKNIKNSWGVYLYLFIYTYCQVSGRDTSTYLLLRGFLGVAGTIETITDG